HRSPLRALPRLPVAGSPQSNPIGQHEQPGGRISTTKEGAPALFPSLGGCEISLASLDLGAGPIRFHSQPMPSSVRLNPVQRYFEQIDGLRGFHQLLESGGKIVVVVEELSARAIGQIPDGIL